jgi:hypothetical protein
MPLARSVLFSSSARLLATEAARRGLIAPGFRCPPRVDGVVRAIRRLPDGSAVVAVRVRGREHREVVADMVEGIVVANGLDGEEAGRLRGELLAAVTDDGAGAAGGAGGKEAA